LVRRLACVGVVEEQKRGITGDPAIAIAMTAARSAIMIGSPGR
jgi:sulfate adenylyltransferase subunit 1 (EFTu-like GTPase family)